MICSGASARQAAAAGGDAVARRAVDPVHGRRCRGRCAGADADLGRRARPRRRGAGDRPCRRPARRRPRLLHLHLGHRRAAQGRHADPRQHPGQPARRLGPAWSGSGSARRCSCRSCRCRTPTSTRRASSSRSRWARRSTTPRVPTRCRPTWSRPARPSSPACRGSTRCSGSGSSTASQRQGGISARLFNLALELGQRRYRERQPAAAPGRHRPAARPAGAAQGPRALRRPAEGDGLGRRAAQSRCGPVLPCARACPCSRATARPRRRR